VANDLASYLGVESGLVLEHFRKMAADRAERSAPPKADPAKATDRILLPLLLNNAEARAELLERLRDLPGLRQSPLYSTLIAMHDAGEAVGFNALHERLAPADQERLSAIVLESDAGATTVEDGSACIDALRREDKETLRRELKTSIKTAEREGRIRDALDLMQRLSEIG
jgi:hypothetical protein